MFQRLYDSPWHNPFAVFVAALLFALVLVVRRPASGAHRFLWGWAALFTAEIVADAYVTGGWSPLLPHHASVIGTVAVPFVILGDYRFFLLVERARDPSPPDAPTPPRLFGIALAWSMIVPVLAFGTARVAAAWFRESRRLFLLYEVLFLVLASGYLANRSRRLERSSDVTRWIHRVAAFELLTYALWAFADVVILAGSDVGYGIRLIPNLLYYAAFVPFAFAAAPRTWRA